MNGHSRPSQPCHMYVIQIAKIGILFLFGSGPCIKIQPSISCWSRGGTETTRAPPGGPRIRREKTMKECNSMTLKLISFFVRIYHQNNHFFDVKPFLDSVIKDNWNTNKNDVNVVYHYKMWWGGISLRRPTKMTILTFFLSGMKCRLPHKKVRSRAAYFVIRTTILCVWNGP